MIQNNSLKGDSGEVYTGYSRKPGIIGNSYSDGCSHPANGWTDAPCVEDLWFEVLASAYKYTVELFGVSDKDLEVIPDPLPNCRDDFIHPVRVKGRDKGSPIWGSFEKPENSEWIDYSP